MKPKRILQKDSLAHAKGGVGIAAACLRAQLAVFLSGLVLLLIFCAIAASMEDPDTVIRPLSLSALFLSALCGGFYAVRLSRDGVVSGLVSGCMTAVLVLLLSLLPLPDSEAVLQTNIPVYLSVLGSSAAGAMIGKRRKPKNASMARRKRR